jgi:hypothetical protein
MQQKFRLSIPATLAVVGIVALSSAATLISLAATEVTTAVTNNDPPRQSAPCFDGTGRWLKFTLGGRGLDQTSTEVGGPDSPQLQYDEVAGEGGFPVVGVDSLTIGGDPAYFTEVWVYPGGRLASVFAAPPRLTTTPTLLAPRRGRNITQLFICAVDGPQTTTSTSTSTTTTTTTTTVVTTLPSPCPGGQYFWENTSGVRLVSGVLAVDTGVVVPAGTLRVVSYVSMDGYTGREFILQPNERWRVLVGSAATAYTNDIADFVVSDTQTGSLPGIVTGGGNVKIEHWSIGTADYSSPNSVVPVSLCLRVD